MSDADTQAYSSNFVEFSAAKGTAQDFFDRTLVDVKRMKNDLAAIGNEVNLK